MLCFSEICPNYLAFVEQTSDCLCSILLPQETFKSGLRFGKNQTVKGNAIKHIEHTPEFFINQTGLYEITFKIVVLKPLKETFKAISEIKLNDKSVRKTKMSFYLSPNKSTETIVYKTTLEIKEETKVTIHFTENCKLNLSHIMISKK